MHVSQGYARRVCKTLPRWFESTYMHMAIKTGTFTKGFKYFRAKCDKCNQGKSHTSAGLVNTWKLNHSKDCGKRPEERVDWEV